MSLKPFSASVVPEQTASVARRAFPKGSLCIRIFDELGTIFQDQDFADLYSQHGQPGQPPFRLALVTVLQFIEGLSDRGAADAVRGRIDWKYLLCLELDDPGFDYSVLCEFRTRLLEGGAERILFDKILSALRDKKLVKSRTRQRTDSTHVLAAVRDLNRLERVGETLHATLNVLAVAAPEIHERLSKSELLPDKHLVDGGYIEASNLVESRREYDIDLIGPAQSNGRWQQVQGNGFDISNFQVDWDREKVICPAGRESSSWKQMVDGRGNDFIHAQFARSDCSVCPDLTQCTRSKGRIRTVNIKPKELHEALQQTRQREKTKEFKEEYSKRAGVEGTISQGVRAFGLRRSRYVGRAKTRLQHFATAAAINLERVSDWLAGIGREKTRRSAFARVMQPLTA